MKGTIRSTEQLIEEQVHRWQLMHKEKKAEKEILPVITISREPGSGGRIVREALEGLLVRQTQCGSVSSGSAARNGQAR